MTKPKNFTLVQMPRGEVCPGTKDHREIHEAFLGAASNCTFIEFEFADKVGDLEFEGGTIIIEPTGNDLQSDPSATVCFYTGKDSFDHSVSEEFGSRSAAVDWATALVKRIARTGKLPAALDD